MLEVHPVFQALMTLLSFYVLYLGFHRFLFLHLKRKAAFNWKRHVFLGYIVLIGWLVGALGGLGMVRWAWHGFFVTSWHGYVGVAMIPLILIGLFTGRHLDRVKKKRMALPLWHGLNNLALIILALVQSVTGVMTLRTFVLGL